MYRWIFCMHGLLLTTKQIQTKPKIYTKFFFAYNPKETFLVAGWSPLKGQRDPKSNRKVILRHTLLFYVFFYIWIENNADIVRCLPLGPDDTNLAKKTHQLFTWSFTKEVELKFKKKPSMQAAGADPSQCNFTDRQNSPIQQNPCTFWTNYTIVIPFGELSLTVRRGCSERPWEEKDELHNELMTTVCVEQPQASAGSAKKVLSLSGSKM